MNKIFLLAGILMLASNCWAQNPTIAEESAPVQEQAPAGGKVAPSGETSKAAKGDRDLARKKKRSTTVVGTIARR